MNKNELAERILLTHPMMRNYYLIRYEIYKYWKIPFDLFFNEDILNYENTVYGIKQTYTNNGNMEYVNVEINNTHNNGRINHFLNGNYNDFSLPISDLNRLDDFTVNYYIYGFMISIYQAKPFDEYICGLIENIEIKRKVSNLVKTLYNVNL